MHYSIYTIALIKELRIFLRTRCNEYVINGFTHEEITELFAK